MIQVGARVRLVVKEAGTVEQGPQTADRSTTRSKRAAAMETRLLDAAESLYAEGPAALTNRRIGEAAGTTTQAIYTYFGSRDALLDAMYHRAISGVEEIIALAAAGVTTAPRESEVVAALKDAARVYRRFCLDHPGRLRMIRRAASDEALPIAATELRGKLVELIARFGRSGDGEKTALYEARIHLTISSLHGFLEAELDGFITTDHDPDRLFDELIHRCLVPFEQIADL